MRFWLYYDHSFRKQIQAKTDWNQGLISLPISALEEHWCVTRAYTGRQADMPSTEPDLTASEDEKDEKKPMISVAWLKWKKHSYFVCDKKDKFVLKTIKILNIAEHLQALKQKVNLKHFL